MLRKLAGRVVGPLVLVIVLACSPSEPAGQPSPLDFEALFADGATGRTPTSMKWSADGQRLAFFYEDDDGKGIWLADTDPVGVSLVGRTDQNGLGDVSAFHWHPDGSHLLLEKDGDLVLLSLIDSSTRPLTQTEAAEDDPKLSPDGRHVAFVRENDIWLLELATQSERRLTNTGEKGVTLNGKTDWVYWEEIWGRSSRGLWWSPRGDRVAYYQFDETPVREYPLVDFTKQYPEVTWQKYPKAGEANPIVRLGVLDLTTGETNWLATTADDDSYLARVDWLPDGERLAFQRLNRDQDHLELIVCDTTRAACSPLAEQRSNTWVNLTEDLHFFPDGRFVWTTEETGWRKLWLYGANGAPERELTPAGWTTDHLNALVVDQNRVIWTGFPTTQLGARHRTVFAQDLSGEAPQAVSAEELTAAAVASANSGHIALRESRGDTPTTASIATIQGERLASLPATAPAGLDVETLPSWKFLTIPGPSGLDLPAALLEPVGRVPGRRYPVIQYHYGCPASQVVRDAWSSRRDLWHRLMASRGYGVLLLDNGSSNFFGKQGAERAYRRFGAGNVAAQRAGIAFLKTLDWADTSRVGLWGWSGGGSNTLYSILDSPGTWRAAVAGAPVTDWRLYDTIWTERYLDHPADNETGYEESSPVTYASQLEDALLLVHGTADDNVHPQNTFAMAAELVAAGRPFELAIHPRQKHGFRSKDSRHFYQHMTRFFDRELAPH